MGGGGGGGEGSAEEVEGWLGSNNKNNTIQKKKESLDRDLVTLSPCVVSLAEATKSQLRRMVLAGAGLSPCTLELHLHPARLH